MSTNIQYTQCQICNSIVCWKINIPFKTLFDITLDPKKHFKKMLDIFCATMQRHGPVSYWTCTQDKRRRLDPGK